VPMVIAFSLHHEYGFCHEICIFAQICMPKKNYYVCIFPEALPQAEVNSGLQPESLKKNFKP